METDRYPTDDALRPTGVDNAVRFATRWAATVAGVADHAPFVEMTSWSQGWTAPQFDRSCIAAPLRLGERTYARGLGTHGDSTIVLRANRPLRRVRAWIGMDNNPDCRAGNAGGPERMVFAVEAGGRELWRSPALGIDSPAVRLDLALPDTVELTLKVWDINGNIRYAHVDWADLEFELADGGVVRTDAFSAHALPVELPPFSFRLDGVSSAALLPRWQVTRTERPAAAGVTARQVIWRDPATSLECVLELLTFDGYPAVEWLLRVRNAGTADTPLLEDILPLDTRWSASGQVNLRRSRGPHYSPSGFEYLVNPLAVAETIRMTPGGGKSSSEWLPFFNLETDGSGIIAAIGWSGQWTAEFARDREGVRIRAGQERTRLVLHPGEEIRTPRMALLFWDGDPQAGHNTLRRFILTHHTPRPNGELLRAPLTVLHWGGMKTAHHLERIAAYRQQKLGYEYYWIDAGWYGPPDSYSPDESGDWAKHVGNWTINPAAHPNGLRPISDAAGAAGMRFLLWFEPERAVAGTPLTVEHPEWFLGDPAPGKNLLFNLGNAEARRWLTDFISDFMSAQGVHLYRQDFNFDPLPYWRAADAPDRQGMTEIRHVEGLYAFWDELRQRHPGLVIDNCASGGRRIDLETISRSIPLWRSDWQCGWVNDGTPGQTQTMGLSYWVPLSGTAVLGGCRRAGDTYNFRSSLSAAIQFTIFPYESFPIDPNYPWDWHRRMMADFRRARPLFYGDYYPLTPCTPAYDAWAALQMHRSDLDEGCVLAFRRQHARFLTGDFPLQGLVADSEYELEDADTRETWRQSGAALLTRGIRVTIETPRGSRLVFYRRVGA